MAKDARGFWSAPTGRFLLALLILGLLPVAGGFFLLHSVTHPPRNRTRIDPEDLMLKVEEVPFEAADGVMLSGWIVRGAPGSPAIVLCHDLGGSRFSLLNHAVSLNRIGYPLFVFDFRGHGESGGGGASLGVREKDDVRAAIAFLKTRPEIRSDRVGVWGIGMGAYAAALAAAADPSVTALALDSVYPDVPAEVDRLLRAVIPPALHGVVPLMRVLYNPYFGFRLSGDVSVSQSLDRLADRSVLLIAGTDRPDRFAEEKAIYAALPDSPSGSRNFLKLRASVVSGLYAEEKRKYDEAIVSFFKTYLPRGGRATGPARPLEVIER